MLIEREQSEMGVDMLVYRKREFVERENIIMKFYKNKYIQIEIKRDTKEEKIYKCVRHECPFVYYIYIYIYIYQTDM